MHKSFLKVESTHTGNKNPLHNDRGSLSHKEGIGHASATVSHSGYKLERSLARFWRKLRNDNDRTRKAP